MDTSKQYVSMCEKASELQDLWKPTDGDWFIHDYRGSTHTTPEFERQIWGDNDEVWKKVEVLCYQPDDAKNYWVGSTSEKSLVLSARDIVKKLCIWLPRQDQLQKMVIGEDVAASLLQVFYGWILETDILLDSMTMEQLWLAFLMREKYNKVWNGDDWKKI